jgi:hypothetical protein
MVSLEFGELDDSSLLLEEFEAQEKKSESLQMLKEKYNK